MSQTHELFVEAFLVDNRVTNMVRLMGYHPRYLTCFLRFHTYLMFQDGPLPLHLRHYIAILVRGYSVLVSFDFVFVPVFCLSLLHLLN